MNKYKNENIALFEDYLKYMRNLFIRKNEQYGNNFEVYGLLGVTCEIMGALARLPKMVIWSEDHGRSGKEQLIGIFGDIANYSVLALICIGKNNWDGRKQ